MASTSTIVRVPTPVSRTTRSIRLALIFWKSSNGALFSESGTSRIDGATMGSPPWRRINSAISFARRLSKEMTLSPCRLDRELDSMDSGIIAGSREPRQPTEPTLNDHAGSDGAMGTLVDDDEAPRGPIARVAVNDKRLLHFNIDSGNVVHLELRYTVNAPQGIDVHSILDLGDKRLGRLGCVLDCILAPQI